MAIFPHELPHKKRLDYIDRIFIRHDAIKIAAQALQHLTFAPNRRREGSVGYIRGYSRCGKSEILKRHIEELTGTQVGKGLQRLIEGNGHLIVYLELSAGETPLGVATRWLRLFEDLRVSARGRRYEPPLRERDAIQRAIDISNDNNVTLVALDEYQNLFRSGSSAAVDAARSMLITMQNAATFPIAITGSPLLEELFSRHEAVKERAGPRVLLKPLPFRARKEQIAFASVIKNLKTSYRSCRSRDCRRRIGYSRHFLQRAAVLGGSPCSLALRLIWHSPIALRERCLRRCLSSI